MHFRVVVSGRDLVLEGKAGARRVGFFASGTIDAESREEAERLAVEKTRHDLDQHGELGAHQETVSRLMLEKVEELAAASALVELPPTRFTFFLQDD